MMSGCVSKFAKSSRQNGGFTLVELVLVITLTGIIAVIVIPIVTQPINSYMAVSRRAALVDSAESAVRRMQRDVRHALPNSIRINGGTTLEILYAVDGGRYRYGPDSGNTGADPLDFTSSDTGFDVIGTLQQFADITPGSDWVVVYNLAATGTDQNAYAGNNRVLLDTAGNTSSHLELDGLGIRFPLASPQQRFFVVNGPVTYRCNLVNGVLERYSGYTISSAQSDPPAATAARIAENVSACSFVYNAGTAQRAGLLTISLAISDQGETITLLHQVHVDNSP